MKNRSFSISMSMLCAIALGAAQAAGAGTFSTPTTIAAMQASNGGFTYGAPLVAIDGNGHMVAALAVQGSPFYPSLDSVQSATASFGGAWSAPAKVAFPGNLQSPALASLLSTDQGFTNLLIDTTLGLASTDHISGNSWTSAVIVPSNGVLHSQHSNRSGDQLLLDVAGAVSLYTNTSATINAVFRRGSAPWGSPEAVATANNATLEASELAADGSALVVWSTSNHVCTVIGNRRHCTVQNYVRHVSSRAAGNLPWVDVGALPTALATASILDLQGDASGNAVFLLANPSGGARSVVYRGGTFSAAAVAFTDFVQNYLGLAPEMRLDDSGHATIVLGVLGLPSNNNLPGGNYSIAAVEGDVASNTWSPSQVISGTDDAGGFVFELNSAGVAVVAYQNNYYVQLPPSVRAVARSASAAAWSAPVTIDSSFPTYAPLVADINPSGEAVIGYTGYHYVGSTSTIANATVRAFLYKP